MRMHGLKNKKTLIGRARCFGNVFRFIDDLTTRNDYVKFERSFQEMYSPELEFKKEI